MSKTNPLVSIMIPVYNRADYVASAIESVLAQTYKNFELIIHDDASTDGSLAIIKQFHDPRLRVIHTIKNHGMLGGWNYLLKYGRGKYIKQMGSDDLLSPRCLELQIKAMEDHPSVSLVTCQRQVIGDHGQSITTYQFAHKDTLASGLEHAHWILTTLRENKIGEPAAVLFRRALIKRAGMFDPRFSQFADFEYWIRHLAYGDLLYLHKPLCSFRTHDGSNTTAAMRDGRFIGEIFTLINKYYKEPFFVKTYSLTPADRDHVTSLKIKDTLKNIKDLVLSGYIARALRYTLRLMLGFFIHQ